MAQNAPKNTQTRKYECRICHEQFSYPRMPWRIYEASSNALLFSASSLMEAESWARENCYRVMTCI